MAELPRQEAQVPPFQMSEEARARLQESGYAAYASRQAEADKQRELEELERGDDDFRLPIDHQVRCD